MLSDNTGSLSVIDFRRQRLVLQWHLLGGTWTACDVPPPLVHGIALIRPSQPNICVYGHGGRLRLQVGPEQFALSENSPRIKCTPGVVTFGLRRHFSVVSSTDGVLFNHSYWVSDGEDFFRWIAARAEDPDWRAATGRRWSEGVPANVVRGA